MASVPIHAQQVTDRFFAETGHSVKGEFLTFYLSAPDPLLVYGLPITEAFFDPVQKVEMQYFQRARFELHTNEPAGKRVTLSILGVLTYKTAMVQAVNMATNTPACRHISQYYVCYAFLAFFDAHGGLAQFGYPISNYSKEGDQYVQYFERARFEYHPELSNDTWVLLSDIGRFQFDQSKRDPILKNPIRGGDNRVSTSAVTRLQVRAYASRAVVSANSQQGLTVIVLDQNHKPVESALVKVKIKWPSGDVVTFSQAKTNVYGIAYQNEINVGNLSANQLVLVEVDVTFGDLHAATTTGFSGWW